MYMNQVKNLTGGKSARLGLFSLGVCLALFATAGEAAPPPRNPGPVSPRGIKNIKRADGIFIYSYRETLNKINPHRDYKTKMRVTDRTLIKRFRGLLAKNALYQPAYKKRCLPVWDTGLEFREKNVSRTFLFSFRCKTMKLVEENIYRDFKREYAGFYALFRYEINSRTSEKLS